LANAVLVLAAVAAAVAVVIVVLSALGSEAKAWCLRLVARLVPMPR
jgi:hypothetical protein